MISAMRFSIRDLFWLTVVAAVSVCWFIDRRSVANAKAALEAERRAANAELIAAKEERERYSKMFLGAAELMKLYEDKMRPVYYPPKDSGL